MERLNQDMEYQSATPEEIRFELGLPPDATQSEVVRVRRERYEASMRIDQVEDEVIDGEIA